jgi:ribosomal protein S18 acetylase RimI-like enzyme
MPERLPATGPPDKSIFGQPARRRRWGRAWTVRRVAVDNFDCPRLTAREATPHENDIAMIRPTVAEETPDLLEIARGTGVFKPLEIVALNEVLDDYHATMRAAGHLSITYEQEARPIGFAYYAPAAMTDRTWYLYWIAVHKSAHARGIGGALLRHAENDVRLAGGRLFLIETSSLLHYEPTRLFYRKHGYECACVLDDYYADGDHMVIFRKRFAPVPEDGRPGDSE